MSLFLYRPSRSPSPRAPFYRPCTPQTCLPASPLPSTRSFHSLSPDSESLTVSEPNYSYSPYSQLSAPRSPTQDGYPRFWTRPSRTPSPPPPPIPEKNQRIIKEKLVISQDIPTSDDDDDVPIMVYARALALRVRRSCTRDRVNTGTRQFLGGVGASEDAIKHSADARSSAQQACLETIGNSQEMDLDALTYYPATVSSYDSENGYGVITRNTQSLEDEQGKGLLQLRQCRDTVYNHNKDADVDIHADKDEDNDLSIEWQGCTRNSRRPYRRQRKILIGYHEDDGGNSQAEAHHAARSTLMRCGTQSNSNPQPPDSEEDEEEIVIRRHKRRPFHGTDEARANKYRRGRR